MEVTLTDTSQVVAYDVDDSFAIENFNFEQFIHLFNATSIDLSKYWLVNIGSDQNGNKKYVHLIIRAYATKPFFGPHLVSIFVRKDENAQEEMMTFWVHSLTFLRKELFQFHDRLSFERSTFLVPGKNNAPMIRIKSIRGFVTVPQRSWEQAQIPPPRKQRSKEKINELLNHNIQNLVMFLNRETGQTMQESIIDLRNYVIDYCTQLSLKFEI